MRGDFAFQPSEYWRDVSSTARDFVRACLTVDPAKRLTCEQALEHPWLREEKKKRSATEEEAKKDLLPSVKAGSASKKTRTHSCSLVVINSSQSV